VIDVRNEIPGVNVLVHPECKHEVVSNADVVGSTEKIIQTLQAATAGSAWAIGTELNLVRRLANQFPDKKVTYLDKTICYCSTMNRIDLPHLVWILEAIADNRIHNVIKVDEQTAIDAKIALDRMLTLPATSAPLD
jgi:quinolinate synthase